MAVEQLRGFPPSIGLQNLGNIEPAKFASWRLKNRKSTTLALIRRARRLA
jgi:hypothetical protein